MSSRTLKGAADRFTSTTPNFASATTFARPGERQLPGALLVERGLLTPDPEQPRKHVNKAQLEELAESIRQVGVLQPLRVRPGDEGKYIIVNGERRWRAAILADVPEIPVIVRDSVADVRCFEMLVENLQRADLTPAEEAYAYQALIGQGYSERALAGRLGVHVSRISRTVRVFANVTLSSAVASGAITKTQAQELLTAPTESQDRLVQDLSAARASGHVVTMPEIRQSVREAREGVANRNTSSEDERLRNPNRTVDVATKHVIERLHSLVGRYPEQGPSCETSRELLAALASVHAWVERVPSRTR